MTCETNLFDLWKEQEPLLSTPCPHLPYGAPIVLKIREIRERGLMPWIIAAEEWSSPHARTVQRFRIVRVLNHPLPSVTFCVATYINLCLVQHVHRNMRYG